MTLAPQNNLLNVLKCFLSIRRTKTDKLSVYFYEILSTAGLCSSRLAFGPDTDEEGQSVTVETESLLFLTHTEELFSRQEEATKKLPATLPSSLQGILGDILTAEAIRESMDNIRGCVKNLEERIREEIFLRLGYRATAYLKAERKNVDELVSFLGDAPINYQGNQEDVPLGDHINFLIPCTPFIDPVRGTPVGSLKKGDFVVVFLPAEDCPLKDNLRVADPEFDGTVKGEVLSVHRDRQGNFTLLVHLSDEFNGVITLEGNAKIRTTVPDMLSVKDPVTTAITETDPSVEKVVGSLPLTPELFFLLFGAGIALFGLMVFFRFFR